MDWPVCKLQVCNLVFDKFAPSKWQNLNNHPKFDNNFDIQCQLEHLEYDMNHTQVQEEIKWKIIGIK